MFRPLAPTVKRRIRTVVHVSVEIVHACVFYYTLMLVSDQRQRQTLDVLISLKHVCAMMLVCACNTSSRSRWMVDASVDFVSEDACFSTLTYLREFRTSCWQYTVRSQERGRREGEKRGPWRWRS
jgi:hypothetical protein